MIEERREHAIFTEEEQVPLGAIREGQRWANVTRYCQWLAREKGLTVEIIKN